MLNVLRRREPRFADTVDTTAEPTLPQVGSEAAAAVASDCAAELYRWAPLALTGCALLAVLMMLAIDLTNPASASWTWLTLCLLWLGAQLVHVVHWRRSTQPASAQVLIRQFSVGVVIASAIWAALPWLIFPALDASGKFIVVSTLVCMVLAAIRFLGLLRKLAMLHAALLLLPAAAWLLDSGDTTARLMGVMTLLLLALSVVAILSVHHALQTSVRVAHDNHHLSRAEAEHRDGRHRAERLLAELTEAHALMERAKVGLERRIEARTHALEDHSHDLARQAVTDALTGLPNRKGINQHLSEMLTEVVGAQSSPYLALLFLDLDHFKEVNDLMGHVAGDAVLCVVAERLRESLPRGAFAARWGGDEFVVVLPGLRRAVQAQGVAEQLRAALSEPVRLEERVVRIGCCVGIAMAPEHGSTPEALIIAADQAVYSAKAEGAGRVRLFDQILAEQAGRQNRIAQALPAAVELGQLQVAYQPIVSTADGSTSHVEALARWWHPQWGAVSPAEFIPVAEASGLIHVMGRWVLRQACRDAARWPGAQPPKVSVNVSAMQVTSGRLAAQVREALAAAGLPAQRLVIELTESMPLGGRDQVDKTLKDLRAMGVTLAIDDFGTGYSSLSSLMRQPLSMVKVDKSFVQDVPGEGELLIKATIDVARCFGLDVVAEGVETQAQQTRLTALGVNFMQGYLFGRPMSSNEFAAWLALRDDSANVIALRA